MITRRAFIASLAGGLLAAPLAAEAQKAGKVWRIGLFHVGLDHVPPSLDGLREGLTALGYEEGKNIHFDWRNLADWFQGQRRPGTRGERPLEKPGEPALKIPVPR